MNEDRKRLDWAGKTASLLSEIVPSAGLLLPDVLEQTGGADPSLNSSRRSMHTVTNFFIANLSAADALIGLFSIPFQFQAALLQRWDLPRLLCKLAPFVKEVSVSCTAAIS